MNHTNVPVGIVGAGPVGLACALRLASFGIRSVILEADAVLRKAGSRACCIQGDVVEILDKVGCADQIAAEGIAWHVARTYVRGEELSRIEFPRSGGFAPFINISQYRTQQIMLERLNESELTEVLWSHRVTGVSQDAEGVCVYAETPDGPRELHFQYLVACDGIHSEVRRLTGVEWTGYSHGDRFLITDIRADIPLAHERHFHFDPPFNPGRQLVMHAQPDNLWRIDWQLPPETDIDEERRTNKLDERIRAVIGRIPYEIDWLSTYRFNQRVVERLRHGRVFFAGDAAHALPPYGARGMNSGIQDIDNLAWKLNLVLSGRANDSLLDSYHVERYAAARENLRVTEATIRFMVPAHPARRWLRNALLRVAPGLKFLRHHVNSGKMAEPHVYRDSPIIDRRGRLALVGSLAPDGNVLMDGRRLRLRELLGTEFVGLFFANSAADARQFVEQATAHPNAVPVRLCVVLPVHSLDDTASTATLLVDEDRQLQAAFRVRRPTWFLVRPDGHIAAARDLEYAAEFSDALRRCADALQVPGMAHPYDSMTERELISLTTMR
jgi:3-(3-hydroxy-phenyl)propionate hydroxylase